jgi:hypothetical protein
LLGRYELTAGISWNGAASLGSLDASLTAPAGDRYRLFSTTTEIAGAPAFDVRIGRRLTRLVQVELAATYSSPLLTTRISNDAEDGAATVASESLRQITVVGAAVIYLPRRRAARALPFVTAGGGYLRQLHEGDVLAQTGSTYHVGAGVIIPVASRGRAPGLKQFGIRADVCALFRTAAVTIDEGVHVSPAVTAAAFVRF